MGSCDYKALLDHHFHDNNPCGISKEYPNEVEHLELNECTRDVSGHLKSLKLSADEGIDTELKLLLARVGIFDVDASHKSVTICPRHRGEQGLRWRTRKINCSIPNEIIQHVDSAKGSHRVTSSLSAIILKNTGTLVPVGLRKCAANHD
ncbi:uncharacterized protein LOC114576220 [Exaiptasia diaphana]|uniref:Uncharacterized protein n=1 Tax=Exaiptasia diaphana TaxID=2652724 RepID=A0A913YT73_EXADI|nr:uncharacterized protein LOC114576220 [Exaiptasia diaphana]